jgi:CRP-like cAMP-binding protein
MPSETADLSVLAALPLLAGLPAAVRQLVERSFTPIELGFGEIVFRQGQAPDAYYVVASGSARVLVEGNSGEEVSLNVLRPGDAFGETSLLEGTPRTATVRASSPLRLWRLDRGPFQAIIDTYPQVAAAFADAERARRINDFLRLHSAFAVLPPEITRELIDDLEELDLADGQDAVRVGQAPDALYLVHDGRLGAWVPDRDQTLKRVRTLRSGEFFGEQALMRGTTRTATVRAEGPVRLLRLSAARFEGLKAQYPEFATQVRERMALYETRDREAAPYPRGAAEVPADPSV